MRASPVSFTLDTPLDMHLHLREGAMLASVAPLSTCFAGAVIMPNLVPPVDSLERLLSYRDAILQTIGTAQFTPFMTLFMRTYTIQELVAAQPHIIGVKLYPAGVTTNSAGGVSDLSAITDTLAAMERLGIPLLVHGETHGFVLDREEQFLPTYADLAQRFPKLTIVMEHITTGAALSLLDAYPNLFASVTLHHLLITLNDMAGELLNPHLFCKPIAKRPEDRDALLQAALSAHPKLMFGSDSAPHPINNKESAGCAAGVFTAPVALPLLAALFEEHSMLHNLQAFVSDNAHRIYAIAPPRKAVTLVQKPWTVPQRYGEVVPFWAGQEIRWHNT